MAMRPLRCRSASPCSCAQNTMAISSASAAISTPADWAAWTRATIIETTGDLPAQKVAREAPLHPGAQHEAGIEARRLVECEQHLKTSRLNHPLHRIGGADRFDPALPNREGLAPRFLQQRILVREVPVYRHGGKAGRGAHRAQTERLDPTRSSSSRAWPISRCRVSMYTLYTRRGDRRIHCIHRHGRRPGGAANCKTLNERATVWQTSAP